MAKLIPTTPCAGLLPKTIGSVTISEVEAGQITLVAPFKGQQKAVSDALMAALGIGFPNPNRTTGTEPRAIWCGMGQALIIGAHCPVVPAACVDHSDAWAVVRIEGADAVQTLARLTPIDLRAASFKDGHTARTLIAHMTVSITRLAPDAFEVMAMRSMAATLVHDLAQAASGVAARGAIVAQAG